MSEIEFTRVSEAQPNILISDHCGVQINVYGGNNSIDVSCK